MKYFIFSLLLAIGLIIPQSSFAQTADAVCADKRNGDACTFTTPVQSGRGGTSSGGTQSGFCDRSNGNDTAANNRLTCKTGQNDWADCTVAGDACKSGNDLGTCKITPPTSPRGSATRTCDTNQKPPGNPGGATAATCGAAPCTPGNVCVNQGNAPTCTRDASVNGKCGAAPCTPGNVCVNQGGVPTCTANAATSGTPSNNGGNTDASSPQSVGFVNPISFNSIPELIAGIINALLGILGAITVAILVLSGFKYMTASNPGAVGQALDGIRNAIVGLMIIMGAFLITQYIISALV